MLAQSSSMVLTGNSSEIWATLVALKMGYLKSPRETLHVFNVTLVVFIPNFTATHAITITSTY